MLQNQDLAAAFPPHVSLMELARLLPQEKLQIADELGYVTVELQALRSSPHKPYQLQHQLATNTLS